MIYKTTIKNIKAEQLQGFFVDWPNPPSPKTLLKLLQNSSKIVVAIDPSTDKVIAFITAISDGVLSSYIPFLEVLPQYQGQGIGQYLVEKMLEQLDNIYMIDLCCDDHLIPYYEKFGMFQSTGMVKRNYKMQAGNI